MFDKFKCVLESKLSVLLIVTNLIGLTISAASWSQTSGPTQPEVQTFVPYNTNELVDPFTGDFTYNIPLLDVGGYPINLVYNSGITMDQEASWVGLGWNVNPGAINRQVRGLPDDFAGDKVKRTMNMADNATVGATIGVDLEFFGFESDYIDVTETGGIFYNTYRGWGYERGLSAGIRASKNSGATLTAGLGYSSTDGVNSSIGFSYSHKIEGEKRNGQVGTGIGVNYNSRSGAYTLNLTGSTKVSWNKQHPSRASLGGTQLSFALPTYTPSFDIPIADFSYSYAIKIGSESYGVTGNALDYAGYTSTQRLAKKEVSLPSYGYMYAHKSKNAPRVLHDFNREKDGTFYPRQQNLAVTNFTYDLYRVSGQGMNALFRPHRSDVGTVYDPEQRTGGFDDPSLTTGLELGGGQAVKVGVNASVAKVVGVQGGWKKGNALYGDLVFRSENEHNLLFESFYFKQVGEKNGLQNLDHFEQWKSDRPVTVTLRGQKTSDTLSVTHINGNQDFRLNSTMYSLTNREARNVSFTILTAKEAAHAGLDKLYNDSDPGPLFSARLKSVLLGAVEQDSTIDHHVSEITVTREDGTRYVYGLPVYNLIKKEVSFSVDRSAEGAINGLVDYNIGIDDTPANYRGITNFYEQVETPHYAYAYLLTAILSPDYVDITGNGPSSDDLGTYTRFNYDLVHTNYRWRTPYEYGKAFYQEGLTSDYEDDKGAYIYGEKQIWYLHSIQTKNYEARFITSDRNDAIGVLGKMGGLPESENEKQRLKKLDRIELYTASELLVEKDFATPVKVVHFMYDYSLVAGVPNNTENSGKLTLKRVTMTYRDSDKGHLSPYEFAYNTYNPAYNSQHSDRWGTHKESDPILPNSRFPYTSQSKSRAESDRDASAWHLSDIYLPTGGKLKVDYEADDYVFVQDKKASMMVPIVGTGDTTRYVEGENRLYGGGNNYTYFFFDLIRPLVAADTVTLHGYANELEELYVNAKVLVKEDRYETIQEFLSLESGSKHIGLDLSSDTLINDSVFYTRGWVKVDVKEIEFESEGEEHIISRVHPLSQASWQYFSLYLPHIVYRSLESMDLKSVTANTGRLISSFINSIANVNEILQGPYEQMRKEGSASKIKPVVSFMRLYHPDSEKIGGGSRVKRIILNDQWGEMTNREGALKEMLNFDFGQEYEYTTLTSDGKRISSGVAAYEPLIGGDENSLVEPQRFKHNRLSLFQTKPFGESFFPGPSVGYSKVTVKNLKPEDVEVKGTGKTVYEFYTSKDFPVSVSNTLITRPKTKSRDEQVPIITPVSVTKHDKIAVSQGYSIELNDMHGKPRAQWSYSESNPDAPTSGVTYKYLVDWQNPAKLSNRVMTLRKNPIGEIEAKENIVGVTYDIIMDARQSRQEVKSVGVEVNTDGFLAAAFPIFVYLPYLDYSKSEKRFRSITTTKVVHRSGILESVTAHDLGASLTTYNRAWDNETGQVLITEAENEFGQGYFSTQIPAHWEYEGMGSSWRNVGLKVTGIESSANGFFPITDATKYFAVGDELLLTYLDENDTEWLDKGWVIEVLNGGVTVIDEKGQHIPPRMNKVVQVIRSGYRNQGSFSAGNVITKTEPIESGFIFENVLNANAVEFSDKWQTYAAFNVDIPGIACNNCSAIELIRPEKLVDFLKLDRTLMKYQNHQLLFYCTCCNMLWAMEVKYSFLKHYIQLHRVTLF